MRLEGDLLLRGYYIPRKSSNGFEYVKEINDETQILHHFVEAFSQFAKEVVSDIGSENEKLTIVCDLFVLVTRSVLSQTDEKAALASIARIINSRDIQKIRERIKSLKPAVLELVEIPADTRPGLNMSGLWVQQLLSTALLLSEYKNERPSGNSTDYNSPIVRTALLFYGWGRIGEFVPQPDKASGWIQSLLEGIVKKDTINQILSIYEKEETLLKINNIWWYSQGYARIRSLAMEILSKELDWTGDEFDNEKKWKNVEKSIAKEIVEHIATANIEKELTISENNGSLCFLFADVSGIQHFIESTDRLVQMKGASALIDGFMKDELSLYQTNKCSLYSLLREHEIGLESVVYSGGGNFVLILNTDMALDFQPIVEQDFSNTVGGARLVSSTQSFPFPSSAEGTSSEDLVRYFTMVREKNILEKNNLLALEPKAFQSGIELRCESCGHRPIKNGEKLGREQRYCTVCSDLLDFGQEYSFQSTFELATDYRPSGESLTGMQWHEVGPMVMNFMAGANISVQDDSEETPNISLIKADVNLAGAFMADIPSISALIEKNILLTGQLDASVESAKHWLVTRYEDALKKIGHNNPNRSSKLLRLRLDLGSMYVGGDDLLLLCPTAYSIQLTLKICEDFARRFDKMLVLSAAVVSFKPDYPIRQAMKATESLLQSCKKQSRKVDNEKNPLMLIDYEILTGNLSSHEELADLHEFWKRNALSQRPMIIFDNWNDVLTSVAKTRKSEKVLDALVKQSTTYDATNSNLLANLPESFLKIFHRSAIEILGQIHIPETSRIDIDRYAALGDGLSFSIYMYGREDVKQRPSSLYRDIGILVIGDEQGRMGLLDAEVLSRLLMGGLL